MKFFKVTYPKPIFEPGSFHAYMNLEENKTSVLKENYKYTYISNSMKVMLWNSTSKNDDYNWINVPIEKTLHSIVFKITNKPVLMYALCCISIVLIHWKPKSV